MGSTIGLSCAYLAYRIYWPSPFSFQASAVSQASQARFVYGDADDRASAEDFELTELPDDDATVFHDDEEAQAQQVPRR